MTADEARQEVLRSNPFYKEVRRAIERAVQDGGFRCEVNAEPSDTLAATISSLRKEGYYAKYDRSLQIRWFL
jgi:hypothetical protein